MSLRARLLASLAVMLIVALFAAGFLLVELTRASLVDRVDADLRALSGPGSQLQRLASVTASDNDAGRRLAVLRLDRNGSVVRSFPSGFAGRPRSPPLAARLQRGHPGGRLRRDPATALGRRVAELSAHPPALAARQRDARGRGAARRRRRRGRHARPDASPHGRARPDRAPRRGLDRRPPRPAPARAHLARGRGHRRRRPHPPNRRPPRQHRGRPARDGVRRDARPDRDELRPAAGGARCQGGERGAAAPVRGGRLARAAHATHRGSRLRRPVPGWRPRRPGRARHRA